jgi:hypothetical protein
VFGLKCCVFGPRLRLQTSPFAAPLGGGARRVGHGGIAVWASENIWNNLDVDSLAPQPQQPLLFTMNCLNGYFHFPSLNALAEQLVKAEGRGAVAAFAPSGLSVDDPAHRYHKLLLPEITSGRHERLGDAVLAAQNAYADSGDLPELLAIDRLFGDPRSRFADRRPPGRRSSGGDGPPHETVSGTLRREASPLRLIAVTVSA